MVQALANAAAVSTSPYRSEYERIFSLFGRAIIEDHYHIKVVEMTYEPETFNIPGARYTPDFRIIMATGQIVFVEVKGSKKQRGYVTTRTKLRATAELNRCYKFIRR